MVRRLVEFLADSNVRDARGQTPLFWASRVEVCRALVEHCGAFCMATDAKGVQVPEWHRRQVHAESQSMARYLFACNEIRSLRGRQSWAVWDDGDSLRALATSLARHGDVASLCSLEDEFIDDHGQLFPNVWPSGEVYEQIGLNPDRASRRRTIQNIAQLSSRTGKVRGYTLKCTLLRPSTRGCGGARRTPPSRSQEVIGYVYFRICDGEARTEDEIANDSTSKRKHPNPNFFHIVLCHVKVNRSHQNQGVGTLLLAGVLQFAEVHLQGFKCRDLCLTVYTKNVPAVSLYRKLGFSETVSKRDGEEGWIDMHLSLAVTSLADLLARWLRRVRGGSVAPLDKPPGGRGKRCLEAAFALSEADSREGPPEVKARRMRRKTKVSGDKDCSGTSSASTSAGHCALEFEQH